MTEAYYDIVVVGGGIHGVGVAQAAAAQGYSVLVLEKNQIGSGTSSRSSKLIHGGLRYLETAELQLVRESLYEQELLLHNAPDLVKLIPFYIPVYKSSQRGSLKIGLGLSLYALLGGFRKNRRFRSIPRSHWVKLDGLKTEDLLAVYQYWDAQTDDQALCQAVMNSALALGAEFRLPAMFKQAVRENDRYRIDYHYREGIETCHATAMVNAAGPWVEQILTGVTPVIPKIGIDFVQGTHILLDAQINQGIYYLESQHDKRPVFVMPWKDQVMVGTTETVFRGNPSDVQPLDDEKRYLLEVLTHYFPKFRSTQIAQIKSAFAGLRVLPQGRRSFGERSRETLLEVDDIHRPRLLTIYGGKLTTYRSIAQDVLNQLEKSLPEKQAKADTRTIALKPSPSSSSLHE